MCRAYNDAIKSLARRKRIPLVDYYAGFCAQQAAEKALKALLLSRQVRFPYVHNTGELLRCLEEAGEDIPPRVEEAEELTDYAVETRYPSPGKPVSEEEYLEAIAVALAEDVVRWVEERLS